MLLLLVVALVQNVLSDQNAFDCPMRQLALEFAQEIQPWLTKQQLQQVADALNGAEEANNCNVSISSLKHIKEAQLPNWNDLDDKHSYSDNYNYIFVDYVNGNDVNDGTIDFPLKYLETAIIKLRKRRTSKPENNNKRHIILREGRHYLNNTIYFGSDDNNLIITNYNNELAEISGAKPLNCDWVFYKNGTGNGKNIYSCKVTDDAIINFTGLRVNGSRGIRARYPNANPEIDGFGSTLRATSWFPSTLPTKPDEIILPTTYPIRNDTAGSEGGLPYFWYYNLGVGGPCKYFDPPAGYWCSGKGQGGGPTLYVITSGLTYTSKILPNAPYANTEGGIIQSWRPGHWATWMFEMDSSRYDPDKGVIMFLKGGFQGSRGNNNGDEFYVDNILEELDYENEWYFDTKTKTLYYYNNYSNIDINKDLLFEYTDLKVLMNYSNTSDISLRGVVIRDSAKTFMDPHGMPSGGDWALQKTGAIYIENSDNIMIENNVFTRLDGIAISINKYARNITVYKNEIVWNGASAITAWGDTFMPNNSLVSSYGMGYDGTKGTQPRMLNISFNYVHEIGLWEKQSSFYFQAKSCQNYLGYNIFYNGPRAGVNFNDGFGGGNTLHKNLLFNTCRESGDHGPFNSWDRQVYVTKVNDGVNASPIKKWDTFYQNFIIANYHSSMAIDNDDGSCYYHSYENFMIYTSYDTVYATGLKNNFGGHDNHHYSNIYGYVPSCFQTDQDMKSGQLAGHNDLFENNTCILRAEKTTPLVPNSYGQWNCAFDQDRWPILGNNTIYTNQAGTQSTIGLCTLNEASFQTKFKADIGTAIYGPANDTQILQQARYLLWK